MNQDWFEMRDLRHRSYKKTSFVPLRVLEKTEEGENAQVGYKDEFLGIGTAAFPLDQKMEALETDWGRVGLLHSFGGYVDGDCYVPSDELDCGDAQGLALVLEQHLPGEEQREWHLHQDLVLTLKLKREGDEWLAYSEGYCVVARLRRNSDGQPTRLEISREHLLDYLCARQMGLRLVSFQSRTAVLSDVSHITWPDGEHRENPNQDDLWEGYIRPIHEGSGMLYGEEWAVFRHSRTDVDTTDDLPELGPFGNAQTQSEAWRSGHTSPKLFRVAGERWFNEWIEPGLTSTRIRRDPEVATASFITDTSGTLENQDTLPRNGRWLWFNPSVISALLGVRGGRLGWHTRETGSVAASHGHGVHFGLNALGLVNVFAKDIADLPQWQQRIWAGHTTRPVGGVSTELMASQVHVKPAGTEAPEARLELLLLALNVKARAVWGAPLFRDHPEYASVLKSCHRFRVSQTSDLYALAKDLARLLADSIDTAPLHKVAPLDKKDERRGSLKSLEKALAVELGADAARSLMSPLFGVYDLRLADAHLPPSSMADALTKIGLNTGALPLEQATQLLESTVSTLDKIYRVLESWNSGKPLADPASVKEAS